jgi:hypothetical protein
MDRPYTLKPFALRTADGQRTLGFLYTQTGKEKSVVCLMHPREFSGTPYLVPDVLDAGCACWVQAPRSIGNDLRLEHEVALLDVAAGVAQLRKLGFEHVTLAGTSGGAGLYGFYTQQALRAPERRLTDTPAGRPVKLAQADMPAPDALVFVSPHPGQGQLLMNGIDPSVIDENDPFSIDASCRPIAGDSEHVWSAWIKSPGACLKHGLRHARRSRLQAMRFRPNCAARPPLLPFSQSGARMPIYVAGIPRLILPTEPLVRYGEPIHLYQIWAVSLSLG